VCAGSLTPLTSTPREDETAGCTHRVFFCGGWQCAVGLHDGEPGKYGGSQLRRPGSRRWAASECDRPLGHILCWSILSAGM
jgi:hypothetical protein